jgi:phenylacetate-CoA ligase
MVKRDYYNAQIETLAQDGLRAIQDRRLRQVFRHVRQSNGAAWAKWIGPAATAAEIGGAADLPSLPFMTKDDLRAQHSLGLLCVERARVRKVHISSGSTGSPIVMPYTKADVEQWTECVGRCLVMAGCAPGDVIQITPSFGLSNGGFGFYHGADLLGMTILPTGPGNTLRQIHWAREFGTRVLAGTVSYGARFLEVLQQSPVSLPALKIGIFGAETFSDNMKRMLSRGLGIEVFDIYGMTETGGVGTLGMDCPAHNGLHVWEDQYLIEIVDTRSLRRLPDGQLGELVVTSLTREAHPVIRFRTGDLTRVVSRDRCACGRTHVRIAPIQGRCDEMIVIRGVNIYPIQIEHAVLQIPGVKPYYQILVEERDGLKDLRLRIEVAEGVDVDCVHKHLKESLGFTPRCELLKPGDLPRQSGKTQRLFHPVA